MKKILKTLTASFVAMLVLPLLTGAVSVKATEPEEGTETNITLHKRVFKEGETPENKLNTGLEDNDFGGDPLAGVEFTMYNITDIYHEMLAKTSVNVEEAQKSVIEQIQKTVIDTPENFDLRSKSIQVVETQDDGKATFGNVAMKRDGKDAVYLFLETKTPNEPTITKIAAPIVLAMPIYKNDNKELNRDIHVYPKNESAENKKEMTNKGLTEVEVNGVKYPNVTTGDTLNYKLTINVPTNITHESTTGYAIKDTPSEGLEYKKGTINIEDLDSGKDYKIEEVGNGFKISFVLNDKVKSYAGKKLFVTYDMKLTAEVKPDEKHENNASVIVSNGPEDETTTEITPPPAVVTGGKKFVKQDAHNKNPLEGAEFVVKQNDTYAKFYDDLSLTGEYVFEKWVDNVDDATKVVSNTQGEFSVKGLLDGDYQLEETKAPSDKYVKLKEDVNFIVKHGEYGTAKLQEIKNTPKGILPSTGGTGIIAFLVLGSAMMLGAFAWSRKHKELNV
ncbi:SpaH/EbpB family LPXTG-anchored major pilin [Vagococcus lutrae]|uniref:SpaH/EbpB family LPXTG-anchored major pilin n=1 Tax=Vagococcus lutrae TaxID=81947 RepID=UPI00200BCE0B|nr:SpaH/EbpB family LPXTG-anchored major pilin [Vagococcus lutrae]MDT2816598.1 SpaH/EbpB family LPXTG-anchored major pilin [Vagococcus lutrae]UQF10929.1 SpaH/EbpB family LPXTG-anchored major pilin [Vagococcus lutrae]UQF22841.1 SpaH/EbpB family LPXTG-anchored major pilin [Vagococcus lutrae]UQF38181.1 SpaH/EbpB family LPXTG-anchored major pilin [Vagococcus lutrae]UQF63238.1 SpaH/EbpB family LPXTG-anchored major pilin [Vagococcus lutrae]